MEFRKTKEPVNKEAFKFVATEPKLRLIVRNLRFPHNIKRFVWDNLDSVSNEENLKVAIDKSKKTKEVAKLYFESLSDEKRLLVATVAMFNDLLNDEDFYQVLKKAFAINGNNLTISSYVHLKRDVRFIKGWGNIAFDHKDYHEGVVESLMSNEFHLMVIQYISVSEWLIQHEKVQMRRSLWFPLILIAKVDPELAFPFVKKLLNDPDDIVKNSAIAPLKELMSLKKFKTLIMSFKEEFEFNEKQVSNPELDKIIYRKILKKYIIRPFIDNNDVEGLVELTDRFNAYYRLYIFVTQVLMELFEEDPGHAISFFRSWHHLDPLNSTRRFQDRLWRHVSENNIRFIVEAMSVIPFKDAIAEIKKWSLTKTTRHKVINRHIKVILACLKAFHKDHESEIRSLLEEWTNPDNQNSLQYSVATSWY